MEPVVHRSHHEVGRHAGRTTLVQAFVFEGVSPAAIGEVLRTAPLVGPESIFGERPGSEETARDGSGRRLRGFSPVPGFRFDVELAERDAGLFVVTFSQGDRGTPYLEGDAVWFVSDGSEGGHGSQIEEEINTERALSAGAQPLTGDRPSLRRWLFFRVGHGRVMTEATARMAQLARR